MERERKQVQLLLNQQPKQKNNRLRKQTRSSNYITTDDCHDDYVVLDFETTGMRAGADKILEVLAIRYQDHEETDRFSTLVNPQRHIPLEVTQRTGISAADIRTAPVIEEIIADLVAFIGELPIVIHDSSFEMGFLESLADFTPLDLPKYTVVDTTRLARKVAAQLTDRKQMVQLKTLLTDKLNSMSGHTDCLATAAIYQYCCRVNQPEAAV
ncbi:MULTISPECIES: exonuclease domain-containing protein [Sporosarcina]|uniref:exonuclease domain-containing protein n=1 Tax=Sporosarcina TaxID=1569 RepID=UPI0006940953|nr:MULTISPECIES: exonuclease domain-containing protein [Sporosarcina]WJY26477.1 exonuclease domain-containing protein [Sporosarcina sp. 0.2-SM1T-5]